MEARGKSRDDPPTAVVSEGQLTSLRTKLPKAFYERVKEVPLRVRGTLYLTLFGNPRTARLHFRDGFEDVPGAGRCEATQAPGRQNYFLLCDSAFRPPKGSLWAEWIDLESGRAHGGEVRVWSSYSPFPADLGLAPIYQYSTYSALQGPVSVVDLHTLQPVAYIQRNFELKDLRLADFERH